MAIVTAPTGTAFNSLDASTGAVTARSASAVSINYSPLDSKLAYGLKLTGSFDAQGKPLALDQAVVTPPEGDSVTINFTGALSNLALDLTSPSLRIDRLYEGLFVDNDIINLGNLADAVNAGSGDDVINGNGGNDRVQGGAGNDAINGGSGIDMSIYTGTRSNYVAGGTSTGWTLTDSSGRDGRDTLTSVERLQFADGKKLALDLSGNAGIVAKVVGMVFGAKEVHNEAIIGIGLTLIDQGMSEVDLAGLAMSVTGKSAPIDVVTLLWTNLVGTAPTAAQAQPFVDLLNGGLSVGQLTAAAAELSLNLDHIDFVGLAKDGLDYI